MHYRNGREAKNGDKIVQLSDGGQVSDAGVLINAVAGNNYCNGIIANDRSKSFVGACLCDCLHVEDVAALLAEKGLDKRPEGKRCIGASKRNPTGIGSVGVKYATHHAVPLSHASTDRAFYFHGFSSVSSC
jgi:hypothetical protein